MKRSVSKQKVEVKISNGVGYDSDLVMVDGYNARYEEKSVMINLSESEHIFLDLNRQNFIRIINLVVSEVVIYVSNTVEHFYENSMMDYANDLQVVFHLNFTPDKILFNEKIRLEKLGVVSLIGVFDAVGLVFAFTINVCYCVFFRLN